MISLFRKKTVWAPRATVRVVAAPRVFFLRTLTFSGEQGLVVNRVLRLAARGGFEIRLLPGGGGMRTLSFTRWFRPHGAVAEGHRLGAFKIRPSGFSWFWVTDFHPAGTLRNCLDRFGRCPIR